MSADILHLANVRLTLEGVPHRMASRAEFPMSWPWTFDTCIILCRTVWSTVGPAIQMGSVASSLGARTVSAAYIDPTDGIEREIPRTHPGLIEQAAYALINGGTWLASGSNI